MGKDNWVDFKEIKSKITIQMVLEHYVLFQNMKKSGANIVGSCPIHKGTNKRQFSVNLEKNMYHCFGNCQSGGNILDLVAGIEQVEIREAGLLLKNWFLVSSPSEDKGFQKTATKKSSPKKLVKKGKDEKKVNDKGDSEPVNKPLTFKLKSLEMSHSFFEERDISKETVKHFGLGFCSNGMMAGRIAIPIHNEKNELVAYCGRAVTDEQIEQDGKYKLPPKFVKSLVLYNLNRQDETENTLIVVESYLSVWRFYQAGFNNVVALMGSALSPEQETLLVSFLGSSGRVILLFDNDESGQKCKADCLERLSSCLFVKALDISAFEVKKPHQLSESQIKELLK